MKKKIYFHQNVSGLAGYKELLSKRKYRGIPYLILRVKVGEIVKVKNCRYGWLYWADVLLPTGLISIPYPSKKIDTEREMIKIAKKYIAKEVDKIGKRN